LPELTMTAVYPTETPVTFDVLWTEICTLAHQAEDLDHGIAVARDGESWRLVADVDAETATLAALFLPLLSPLPENRPLVIAHLAQSLDGRIARPDGESRWITGDPDLDHTHRLRAFCDAVLVGAETVAHDDCQLTVRRCEGPQPLRVVVDPSGRVPVSRKIFIEGSGATLWLVAEGCQIHAPHSGVEVLPLPVVDGAFRVDEMLRALSSRGVRRLFVEGGGVTVAYMVKADCLDRLHLAVAPMLMGDGRSTLGLALGTDLSSCPRPIVEVHPMGPDWIFDCHFQGSAG